ncbi:nuclear transport factor 2 family protein [Bernardetia sp. Wsw4-3y2]|uniref:nuclear transport factor 2 family protein n=1 Tax=unclassified Bernardetia TaxID=2647129 RepID=UPI0030CD1E0F
MKKYLFLFLLFFSASLSNLLYSQNLDDNLQGKIMKMDSLLFDVAFNECNLTLYKKIMSQNLEFYDDRTGLNTSIEKEIAAFEDRCSKPFKLTRKLIETNIHKLGAFGAVQTGIHIFLMDGKPVEVSKFITVWEFINDQWKVKRVISYEHKPLE